MEFSHIECFCAAGELEHFSKAAQRLHMTQPALSASIRVLEAELGVKLFIREGKRVHLSSQGRVLLQHAQRILMERDSFLVQARRGHERSAVRFSATAASEMLPGVINGFHSMYPDIELVLIQTEQETDPADLYLEVTMDVRHNEKETTLMGEPIMLAIPASNPLFQHEAVSLSELTGVPLISLRHGQPMRKLEDYYFRCADVVPHRIIECDSPATLRQMISLGLGVAMVPAQSWSSAESPGVRFVPISSPSCRRYLTVRVEHNDTPVLLLRDYLITHFNEMQKKDNCLE